MHEPCTLARAQKKVEELYRDMQYRPCVVAVIVSSEGKVLFTQHAKNPNYWGYPQGGIDQGEDLIAALLREIFEEVGIPEEVLEVQLLICEDQLDIPGKSREGFTHGKYYFYFKVTCITEPQVTLQPQEASDYRWITPADAPELTQGVPPEKRQSLLSALDRI